MFLNFGSISYILGVIIFSTGIVMLIPAAVDFYSGNVNFWAFIWSAVITVLLGGLVALSAKSHHNMKLTFKDGVILTIFAWVVVVIFAALPFSLSNLRLSYTDAYFETMSGITTTGATIIPDLNKLSYGLHLWRGLLQWVGGLGIVVTGIALLPSLKIGGMDLFKIEAFDTFNMSVSRATKIASGIVVIYVGLTATIMLALALLANFNLFDSLIHSMTSIATAGFSTKNGSIGEFNNLTAEIILMFAMFMGGLPFILIYYFIFFRDRKRILKDQQVLGYILTILVLILIVSLAVAKFEGVNFSNALRSSAFTVVSLVTGTGYVLVDFGAWTPFLLVILLFAMFIGGCSGSSACGIKIFRFQIALTVAISQIKKTALPNGISPLQYNNTPLEDDTLKSVFAYFALFIISFVLQSAILSFVGLDIVSSLSLSATTLANVGPAFGDIVNPVNSLGHLGNAAKWTLVVGMLVGRLEVIGFYTLISAAFWKNW